MKKGIAILVLLVALAVLPLAASAATPWHNGHNGNHWNNNHNGNNWNNARHFSGHGNNQKVVFVQAPAVDCSDCSDDEYEYVTVGNKLYKVLKNPCTSCDNGNGKIKMIRVR